MQQTHSNKTSFTLSLDAVVGIGTFLSPSKLFLNRIFSEELGTVACSLSAKQTNVLLKVVSVEKESILRFTLGIGHNESDYRAPLLHL